MSVVTIENMGGNSLTNAEKLLAGISGGMERAVRSAMQRVTATLRTNSSKAIRQRYALKDAAIRSEQNINVKYSFSGGIQANVIFSGRKIPLYRYSGSSPALPTYDRSRYVNAIISGNWHRVHPGVAAAGHQLVSTSPIRFDHAFVARMKSGHTGIFERTGGITDKGSDEIKERMGSSVAQMLGSEEVSEKLAKQVAKTFEERLDHEVNRILNGFGG